MKASRRQRTREGPLVIVGRWPSYAERSAAAKDTARELRQKRAEERAEHCFGDTEGDEPDSDGFP
jgi:hypothetical protein